jgi:hypothetical protein
MANAQGDSRTRLAPEAAPQPKCQQRPSSPPPGSTSFFTLWYARTFPRLSHQDSRVWGNFPCRRSLPDSRRWRGESAAALVCFEGGMIRRGTGGQPGRRGPEEKQFLSGLERPVQSPRKARDEALPLLGAGGPRSSRRPPLGRRRFHFFWTRLRRPVIALTPGGSSPLQTASRLSPPATGAAGASSRRPKPETRADYFRRVERCLGRPMSGFAR